MDGSQIASLRQSYAEGVKESSRGHSEATPPETAIIYLANQCLIALSLWERVG
jgi:hypothetical protein